MAIDTLFLALVVRTVETLRRQDSQKRRLSAFLISYPDLLVPKAGLEAMFGAPFVAKLKPREDDAEIKRWHGLSHWPDPIYDSASLFDAMEVDITVTDVAVLRGMETIVDLNEPLPDTLKARFDLVVDTGTCEHCFNVGTAFRNICEATARGGYLIHAAPMTRINHGFWNFCPTIYFDYFGDNGFEIKYLNSVTGSVLELQREHPVEPFQRFQPQPQAALYVVAERTEIRPPVWPVQRKYRGFLKSNQN
jgi:hypothetical protein